MNNKGADQTAWMRRLICAFVVRIWLQVSKKSLWSLILYNFFTKRDKVLMSTETSCHFGHFKKENFEVWFYTFYDLIHVYSPGAGADNPLGTSLKKKISLKSDFIHFFHDFIYVYSPRAGGQTAPWGQSFDVNRNILSLHLFVASFKKMSLKSDFIQFFIWFNICGSGRQPPGDKILMSSERPYHLTHLLQVSKNSFWNQILYIFFMI